jgi:hypothetical protein
LWGGLSIRPPDTAKKLISIPYLATRDVIPRYKIGKAKIGKGVVYLNLHTFYVNAFFVILQEKVCYEN